MTKQALKPFTALAPLPVVMASVGDMTKHNIITIAWTGIINSEPPMTYISVKPERYSYDIIAKNREFVINLATKQLAEATDFCGVKSGRDIDKFKEMKLTPIEAEVVKAPLIKESPVNLECKVVDVHEYGSHTMFVAEIVKVHIDDELIEKNGRFAIDEAELVAYLHGEYFGIERTPIGKFGYSIMKSKTKKRVNRETKNRYGYNKKKKIKK